MKGEFKLVKAERLPQHRDNQIVAIGAGAIVLAFITFATEGCMHVAGAEKIDAWGFKIEASKGLDLTAGYNTIQHVDNRRGAGAYQQNEESGQSRGRY